MIFQHPVGNNIKKLKDQPTTLNSVLHIFHLSNDLLAFRWKQQEKVIVLLSQIKYSQKPISQTKPTYYANGLTCPKQIILSLSNFFHNGPVTNLWISLRSQEPYYHITILQHIYIIICSSSNFAFFVNWIKKRQKFTK